MQPIAFFASRWVARILVGEHPRSILAPRRRDVTTSARSDTHYGAPIADISRPAAHNSRRRHSRPAKGARSYGGGQLGDVLASARASSRRSATRATSRARPSLKAHGSGRAQRCLSWGGQSSHNVWAAAARPREDPSRVPRTRHSRRPFQPGTTRCILRIVAHSSTVLPTMAALGYRLGPSVPRTSIEMKDRLENAIASFEILGRRPQGASGTGCVITHRERS